MIEQSVDISHRALVRVLALHVAEQPLVGADLGAADVAAEDGALPHRLLVGVHSHVRPEWIIALNTEFDRKIQIREVIINGNASTSIKN